MLCGVSAYARKIEFIRNYGPAGPVCQAEDVIGLPDGNLLFVATLSRSGQEDIWLVKANTAGDTLWTKVLGDATRSERAQSVILTSSHQLMVAGSCYTGAAASEALLLCADTTGGLLWEHTYATSGSAFGNVVRETADGFVIAGASSAAGNFDAWLVKTDASGAEQWRKTYGGTEYDDCWDMELAPDGGFILTGGNYSFASGLYDDAWLIRTNSKGEMLWRKNYGVADRVDWAWNLCPVKKAGVLTGYVFTGVKETMESMPGAAYGNLHFVKVDLDGVVLWDQSIPAELYRKEGMDVIQLPDESFMISGYEFSSSAKQLYLVHADTAGRVLWDTSVGVSEAFTPRAIVSGKDGSCYTVGSLATDASTQRVFMAKIGGGLLDVNKYGIANPEIIIAPNPARNYMLVRWPAHIAVSGISLCDLTGRCLKTIDVVQQDWIKVGLEDIPAGQVLVLVKTDNGIHHSIIGHGN